MKTAGVGKIFNVLDKKKHTYQLMCMMDEDENMGWIIKEYIKTIISKFEGILLKEYTGKFWNMDPETKKIIGVLGNSQSFDFIISSAVIEDVGNSITRICKNSKYKLFLEDKGEKDK